MLLNDFHPLLLPVTLLIIFRFIPVAEMSLNEQSFNFTFKICDALVLCVLLQFLKLAFKSIEFFSKKIHFPFHPWLSTPIVSIVFLFLWCCVKSERWLTETARSLWSTWNKICGKLLRKCPCLRLGSFRRLMNLSSSTPFAKECLS